MTREELLDRCKEIVTKHRQNQYGTPEQNLNAIAVMWSAYLGVEVEAHDVACLMILLKVVRVKNTPTKEDSWIDIAGYAACGVEVVKHADKTGTV